MLISQSGWHTDAGIEGNVSDEGATASRNGFEYGELGLSQSPPLSKSAPD
jgi:hypothetical protein